MNEEVKFKLTADTDDFDLSVEKLLGNINYCIKDMNVFTKLIENCNKQELKGIATTLNNEIHEAKESVDELKEELLQLSGDKLIVEGGVGELKSNLQEAKDNVTALTNELEKQKGLGNYEQVAQLRKELSLANQELTKASGMYNAQINDLNQINSDIQGITQAIEETNVDIKDMQNGLNEIAKSSNLPLLDKIIIKIKEAFNGTKEEVERLNKRIKRIAISSAIYSGIRLVRNLLSEASGLTEGWGETLGAVKTSVASLLIPVFEKLKSVVQNVFAWISGFVSYLTGERINMIQSGIDALNKKIKKTGTNAKNAGRAIEGSLSGFDEINDIGSSSSSGSSGDSGVSNEGMLESLYAMQELSNSMDFTWAEPLRDVLKFFVDYGDIIIALLAGIVAGILLYNAAMAIYNIVMAPVNATILLISVAIGALIAIIILCIEYWDEIKETVSNVVNTIGKWISDVTAKIGEWFSNAWEKVKEVWGKVKDFFKGVWDGIKNIFGPIVQFFSDIFTKAWNGIKTAFGKVTDFFKGIWDSIKQIFSKVGQVIGSAITDTVKKAVNAVLSTAVKIINGFISAINLAISLINAIPGVNIKKLEKLSVPSFDVGTNYVPQDMLAMVHKGERITPAKYNNDDWNNKVDMEETNSLLNELIQVVASKNVTIDANDIGRASVNYINNQSRIRGGSII